MLTSTIRPAAVAGMFYPGRPAELRSVVEDLLGGAEGGDAPEPRPPKAIVAPHAGYPYSGPIAAAVFRRLAPWAQSVERVILLGPSHRVPLRGLALSSAESFETPLGPVPVDLELAGRIAGMPQVSVHDGAHAGEHSLEVELPFLQVVLERFRVLPLVVGEAGGEEVAEVLEAVWGGPETLIVISSDLSHYLPYERARQVDRETAQAILDLRSPIPTDRACGARPLNGLLTLARRRGLTPALVDLRNSGDTAGDRSQVVGYGAFAFHEAAAHG